MAVFGIKQILAKFFIGDFVRGFVEMAGQFEDGVKGGLLSSFGEVVELHGFGHDNPPFVKG